MSPALRSGASLAFLATFLGACASPQRKSQEAAAQLQSGNATLNLLARERSRGALPEGFAAQVSRAATEERSRATAQLHQAGSP
jgi:hypothetical protein